MKRALICLVMLALFIATSSMTGPTHHADMAKDKAAVTMVAAAADTLADCCATAGEQLQHSKSSCAIDCQTPVLAVEPTIVSIAADTENWHPASRLRTLASDQFRPPIAA
jgi:putative hemolysin